MGTRRTAGINGTKHWTAQVAREVLAAWRASGTSLARFARTRGINPQRVSWWCKRLTGRAGETAAATAAAFVPATVVGARLVVVRLPAGVEVEAPDVAGLPPAWVAELARELAGDR